MWGWLWEKYSFSIFFFSLSLFQTAHRYDIKRTTPFVKITPLTSRACCSKYMVDIAINHIDIMYHDPEHVAASTSRACCSKYMVDIAINVSVPAANAETDTGQLRAILSHLTSSTLHTIIGSDQRNILFLLCFSLFPCGCGGM